MNLITFWDTETTGKPKNYKGEITDLDNWPRITQLAYVSFNSEGKIVHKCETLIKPDGWEIPKEQFFIENNMSTERCEKEGRPALQVLKGFAEVLEQSHTMVAHNFDFDFPVTAAEFIRYGVKTANKPKKICTMKYGTNLCKISGPRGYKWPKLEELHQFLFGKSFEGAHDALNDVLAAADCYFEMEKRGVFLPKENLENPFANLVL